MSGQRHKWGRFGAVVLTGGTGVRLGGLDKASIQIGGRTLLERAVTATGDADEVVVVGDRLPTARPVTWTRENPVNGGPAAGLLAGIDAFLMPADLVFVLAVDMPGVTSSTVARLLDAVTGHAETDAALIVDERGEPQTLAGIYRYPALMSARPELREHEHGLAMRSLVAALRVTGVPALGDEARDVDTWEDLRSSRFPTTLGP